MTTGRIPEAPAYPEAVRNAARAAWFVAGGALGYACVSGAYLEENFPRSHGVRVCARSGLPWVVLTVRCRARAVPRRPYFWWPRYFSSAPGRHRSRRCAK